MRRKKTVERAWAMAVDILAEAVALHLSRRQAAVCAVFAWELLEIERMLEEEDMERDIADELLEMAQQFEAA